MLILNMSNYFLDFFSLGRGYGIAAALATCALAVYIISINRNKLILCYALLSMAILANYTYLNYFIAFTVYITIDYLLNESVDNYRHKLILLLRLNAVPLLFAIIVALIIFIPLQYLLAADEFRWGVSSLWQSFLDYCYNFLYEGNNIVMGKQDKLHIIQGAILGAPIVALVLYVTNKAVAPLQRVNKVALASCTVFLTLIIISVTQRHLLNTMYLDERKAVIYTPIIALIWVAIGAYIWQKTWQKAKVIFVTLFLLFFSNFVSNINTIGCKQWWYNAGDKRTIKYINSLPQQNVSILMEWPFYYSMYMYNKYLYKNTFGKIGTTDNTDMATDTTWDYCFFTASNLQSVHPVFEPVYRATYDAYLFKKIMRDIINQLIVLKNIQL